MLVLSYFRPTAILARRQAVKYYTKYTPGDISKDDRYEPERIEQDREGREGLSEECCPDKCSAHEKEEIHEWGFLSWEEINAYVAKCRSGK